MAKFYRTYTVDIDLDALRKMWGDEEDGYPTDEEILKEFEEMDITDIAWLGRRFVPTITEEGFMEE